MGDQQNQVVDVLPAFAATVAHEIRTPLAAVAGEVELALCRDRSVQECREALRRIGEGVADLMALTDDLSVIGAAPQRRATPPIAPLECVLMTVRQRYAGHRDVLVSVDPAAGLTVTGDDAELGRAIGRILDHAIRHRRDGAVLVLRLEPGAARVRLVVEAEPPGFWPRAWRALADNCSDPATPLRLRTARHILDSSGGTLGLSSAQGPDRVYIELLLA